MGGISPQDLEIHERFARKRAPTMPLPADTDLATANANDITLGVCPRRSVFLLDGDGINAGAISRCSESPTAA